MLTLAATTAAAQEQGAPAADRALSALAEQDARIEAQERQLDAQAAAIAEQRQALALLRQERDAVLAQIRAAGFIAQPAPTIPSTGAAQVGTTVAEQTTAPPNRPVGEAPPQLEAGPELAALPEGMGVLTPRRRFVLDPSIEYTRSSANRLVFRGVELTPGVQVGLLEANDADRDTVVGTVAARFGLTDRIELEARVPYVHRRDRVTTVAQRDEAVSRTISLDGDDVGDIEFTGRYQLNRTLTGPIFVANLRYKTRTGSSPFALDRDAAGVATELSTGSGFNGLEPSVTMLLPSDPVVIFANLGYLFHFKRDIDQQLGGVTVGEVDPGDSLGAALGFGFALNPRFSFSLGYRHNYIQGTRTEFDGVRQKSNSLQVGAATFGMSYRLNDRTAVSTNFEFGVTSDAPDARLVLRVPYAF